MEDILPIKCKYSKGVGWLVLIKLGKSRVDWCDIWIIYFDTSLSKVIHATWFWTWNAHVKVVIHKTEEQYQGVITPNVFFS